MNKSESKYFNTALCMDEALIALLKAKDLEYITVKEICEKAGVNRSTFYLHYETISDLVNETMDEINKRFQSYFAQNTGDLMRRMEDKDPEEFILVTQDYLRPYLRFIKDHKNVYRATFRNPNGMQAHARYGDLKRYIIEPILKKFVVPEAHWRYYIAYYIEGTMAIVKEWLNNDCRDSVETIAEIIESCVRPFDSMGEKSCEK